jgi:hypothetical protein
MTSKRILKNFPHGKPGCVTTQKWGLAVFGAHNPSSGVPEVTRASSRASWERQKVEREKREKGFKHMHLGVK